MHEPLAWVTEGEKTDKILAIGNDSIFTAIADHGDLFNAQDMIRRGSDPKRVLPRGFKEIGRVKVREIRHQRGLRSISIRYQDGEKSRKLHHLFPDSKTAAQAAQAIASATQLSTDPREETASIAAITLAPLLAAGFPLAIVAVALRPIRILLGPIPMFLLVAVVLLSGLGYWLYRLVQRPTVDVYSVVNP
jgi:hypothetical protein